MRFVHGMTASGLVALAVMSTPAAAQYPTKPITIIVPFAAGGPTDVVARLIGDRMSRTLGQPIIIEDIGGAGGTIGMTRPAPPGRPPTATPSPSAIPARRRRRRRFIQP
jgi:tripartite-type tricarboxylate transporter receptor subunit TctC